MGCLSGIRHARGFYAVLAASIGLAIAVEPSGVSLPAMLVAASIIGGLGTPPRHHPDGPSGPQSKVMGDQPVWRDWR